MRSLPETQDWSIYRVAEPVSRAGLPSADLVDFGLRRDEIRRLALLSPEQLDRRNRMAHLSGLDPARLRGDRALDIATALCCSDCAAEGRCSSAVDDGSAAVEAEFCVNSATFGALAAE
jgi:hypothetical protein